MNDAGKHLADMGAALMAIAGLVLSTAQAVTPIVACMTTFMAFGWWCGRYWRAFVRRRRERAAKLVDKP